MEFSNWIEFSISWTLTMVIDSFFVVEDSVVTGFAIVEMLKSTDTFRGGRAGKGNSILRSKRPGQGSLFGFCRASYRCWWFCSCSRGRFCKEK